jgi:hypothetical protein
MSRVLVTVGLTLLALTGVSATDQWLQFRGPQAGVADDDPVLPDGWSETDNIVWRASIPGQNQKGDLAAWDQYRPLSPPFPLGTEIVPGPSRNEAGCNTCNHGPLSLQRPPLLGIFPGIVRTSEAGKPVELPGRQRRTIQ